MREIDEIKDAAGAYRKWALEARKKYIELRLRQDPEIRDLYIRAADRVERELRKLALKTPSSYLRKRQLEELETALRAEADRLTGSLTKAFEQYIEQAVEAGGGYSQAIALDLFKKAGMDITGLRTMFATVNRQAVEACWARTKKGLFLSDRIWEQGENFRNTMRDIIQESVAIGQDAVKTARMLQQYVRQGAQTLARDYPNMMERMKGRIPGDICYEALRLARTEMTAAFGEGTIAAARVAPSYKGMKWVLSHNHPVVDMCDTLAEHDEGLGRGVYSPGDEPHLPAHPNCYDEETEVYTNKGWMHFKDLQGDELILSINPDTKEIEWVPFIAKVVYQYKGKMIHFKNRSFDLMVTPDHRMYITARVGGQRRQTTYIEPARKTISRHEFRIPRVGVWQGEEPEQVTIGRLKIKTEVYCKLMGYFLSEGCAHQRKDNGRIQVTISQCGQNMHQIIRDLDGLPVTQWRGKNHLYLSDLDLGRYLLQFGKSDEKFVPDEIKRLSPRLIRIFLDAYRLGDGTERVIVRDKLKLRSIERQYFTSSKRMADDIGELILKVGNYPSFKVQKSKGKQFKHKNGTYTSNVDIWRVSENTTRAALYSRSSGHGLKVETVDYDGLVYDVQLAKNHVLWVRRNGKTCWSGNCICTLVPVHEEPEKFVERLKKWVNAPDSEPDIEKWYNDIYKVGAKTGKSVAVGKTKDFTPDEIAGVKRGKPMTRDEANKGRPNPNYELNEAYKSNCQSCVVSYEARLRGYDVMARPYGADDIMDRLATHTNLAWIDPLTGEHPEYIYDDKIDTAKKFLKFLEENVEKGKRYTLQFSWKGKSRMGHIVSLDRDENNLLRIYDPQCGKTYSGDIVGRYLQQIKYVQTVHGVKMPTRPKIMRIDDKEFNLDVVNRVLEGAK